MICPSCQADNDGAAANCIACGKGFHALTRGSLLSGRYEILDAIGHGGMGVVYKARDIDLDETVAIKVIRTDGTGKSTDLDRRFRSEIKLARRITHPNVCRIHDYNHAGHLTYIIMEYVPGTDLRHVLRQRGRLPAEEALAIVLQVAHGLEAVHRHGVVHRDLKTPNLMRTPDGTVKLMDFGIAKSLAGDATIGATATGQIVGTPEYMSPEQASGGTVDARSDIYALGVVLFELLTGELPFHGDTPVSTILKLLHEPPPLEGTLRARIPEPVVPILRKALTKDPRERHATASELIAELRQAASSMTSQGDLSPTVEGETHTAILKARLVTSTPAALQVATGIAKARPPRPTASPRTPALGRISQRPWLGHRMLWGVVLTLAIPLAGFLTLQRVRSHDRTDLTDPPRSAPRPASAPSTPSPTPRESIASEPRVATSVPPTLGPSSPPVTFATRAVASRTVVPRAAPPRTVDTFPAPPKASPSPELVAVASAPSPERRPALPAMGSLRIGVTPYAEVAVDGVVVGTTPMGALPLEVGRHTVRLTHPDYQPLQRVVAIRSGETTRLAIDLPLDGVRR
jgi:serine/threonine protein kinase